MQEVRIDERHLEVLDGSLELNLVYFHVQLALVALLLKDEAEFAVLCVDDGEDSIQGRFQIVRYLRQKLVFVAVQLVEPQVSVKLRLVIDNHEFAVALAAG